MKMQPFYGVDQRTGPIGRGPQSADDLRNIDLHPSGSVRARHGSRVIGEADYNDATQTQGPVLAAEVLVNGSSTWLYVATKNGLYRTGLGGSLDETTGFYLDFETGGDLASGDLSGAATGAAMALAKYVADSAGDLDTGDPADPDDKGPAVYVANGVHRLYVHYGSGGAQVPRAVYAGGGGGGGSDTYGVHGVPAGTYTTDDASLEWRDWTADPPAGLYLMGEGREDRMFAWGFSNDPSRIDYSELGRPWNWVRSDVSTIAESGASPGVDGGWWYALAGDNDPIIGVTRLHSKIVVFKREKTLVYSGSPGTSLNLETVYPVGCLSYRSVVQAGNDLLWWSQSGPVSLSGVMQYGDVGMANVGENVWSTVKAINVGGRGRTVAAEYDPENYRVIWYCPAATSGGVHDAIVMYYDEPRRFTLYQGPLCSARCIVKASGAFGTDATLAGRVDGTIALQHAGHEDAATYSQGEWSGDPVTAYWIGTWQDFDDITTRKRALELQLLMADAGAENADAFIAWDYAAQSDAWGDIDDMARVYGEPGAYWGSAVWGTDVWGATASGVRIYDVVGSGHALRLKFEGSSPWAFDGWALLLSQKGRR